jgi:sigma-B regulation protein RsbU (phosphoserine phosphatase)
VAAGVVMSMVKTAVRMHFMTKPQAGEMLLEATNDTLTPLTASAAYATFAYLLISPNSKVEYSVAAHLPIIHYQRGNGVVVRHFIENFPLAMFPNIRYKTGVIDFQPGDVIAIVTDGLTEVSNATGTELGDSYIDGALTRLSAHPLAEIGEEILQSARSFGKTADDKTLLLLRRCETE